MIGDVIVDLRQCWKPLQLTLYREDEIKELSVSAAHVHFQIRFSVTHGSSLLSSESLQLNAQHYHVHIDLLVTVIEVDLHAAGAQMYVRRGLSTVNSAV